MNTSFGFIKVFTLIIFTSISSVISLALPPPYTFHRDFQRLSQLKLGPNRLQCRRGTIDLWTAGLPTAPGVCLASPNSNGNEPCPARSASGVQFRRPVAASALRALDNVFCLSGLVFFDISLVTLSCVSVNGVGDEIRCHYYQHQTH